MIVNKFFKDLKADDDRLQKQREFEKSYEGRLVKAILEGKDRDKRDTIKASYKTCPIRTHFIYGDGGW